MKYKQFIDFKNDVFTKMQNKVYLINLITILSMIGITIAIFIIPFLQVQYDRAETIALLQEPKTYLHPFLLLIMNTLLRGLWAKKTAHTLRQNDNYKGHIERINELSISINNIEKNREVTSKLEEYNKQEKLSKHKNYLQNLIYNRIRKNKKADDLYHMLSDCDKENFNVLEVFTPNYKPIKIADLISNSNSNTNKNIILEENEAKIIIKNGTSWNLISSIIALIIPVFGIWLAYDTSSIITLAMYLISLILVPCFTVLGVINIFETYNLPRVRERARILEIICK